MLGQRAECSQHLRAGEAAKREARCGGGGGGGGGGGRAAQRRFKWHLCTHLVSVSRALEA